ncbi:MAG TPA: hypothetical protein VFJ99_07260 [Solirubrobacterales bacterium]|nr:hypothetical protein [Solirubrobacterales bacterium]
MRSAIAVTIAPAALAAGAIALLLALHAAGAGFHGDPHAVVRDAAPGSRLWDVTDRRAPVIGVTLLVWLAAFALALAAERLLFARSAVPLPRYIGQRNSGRTAARGLGLSLVYLPLVCLTCAALEPSVGAERWLVMLGSPALAALTLAAFGGRGVLGRYRAPGGYAALAFACGATALAYAIDLIGGSALTQLSIVGPNPAGGHRFYGIGNELEAGLVVLILVGIGAALSGFPVPGHVKSRKRRFEGRGPAAFLVVAAVFSFVFAYGRYGADVGAAISLPLGAAVAAALLAGRRDLALYAFLLPIPALILLSAADLITGANAHLTKTVLDAKSGGDVLGVFGHRISETVSSFSRPILVAGLPVVLASAVLAWLRRDRLAAWTAGRPALRAGLLGALAATLVGTLANDSGALLLEVGGAYLLVFLGFAWAESERPEAARRIL